MAAHRNLGAAGAVAQGPGEASGGYTRRGNFFAAPQDWAGHGFDMAPIQQGVGGLSGHPGAAPRASNTDWSAMVGTAGGLLPRQELGPYSGVISATEHWGAGGEFELTETIATNWVTVDALARDRAFTTFLCPPREHTRGPKIAIKTKEFPLTMPSAVPNGGVPPIIGYRSGQRVITMHRIGIALLMNVDEVLMNNYREIFQKFRQIAGSVLQVSRARAVHLHAAQDFNVVIVDAILSTPPHYYIAAARNGPNLTAADQRRRLERARDACGALTKEPEWLKRELEDIDAAFTRGGFTVPTAVVHYHGMLTQASRVMSESLSTWLVDARTRLPQKAPDGPILASFVNGKVAISSPAIHSDSRGVVQDPMVRWEYLGDFSVTHPDMDEAPGTVNRDIRMWDFDSANDAVTLKFADNVLPNAGVWGATGWLEPQLMARIVRECNETARDDADPGHVLVHFSQRDGRRLRQAVCAVGELDANYFPETLRTAYLRGFVEKFAAAHGGVAARGGPYDPDGRIAADIRTSFAFLSQHPFIRPEAVAAVDGAPVRGGRIVGIAAHEALRRIFPSLPANVPGQPAYNFMPSDQLGAHRVAPPAGAAYADIDILDVLMLSGVPAVRTLPLRTKVREATNTWSDASAGAPWLHYVIAFAMAMPIQLANLQGLARTKWCVPFTVYLFRPLGNTGLGDMAVVVPGAETMALFIAHPHLMASTDAMSQDSFYNYSVSRAAVVIDETGVVVHQGVGFVGMAGGAGTDFFAVCAATTRGLGGTAVFPRDPLGAADEYEAAVLQLEGSIFGVLSAGTEGTSVKIQNPMDMTGTSTTLGHPSHYAGAVGARVAYAIAGAVTDAAAGDESIADGRPVNGARVPVCWRGYTAARGTIIQNTGPKGRVDVTTRAMVSGSGFVNNLRGTAALFAGPGEWGGRA